METQSKNTVERMKDSDLKIQFTKGTGPGGQHKNKVETCALVTHIPTGITERCQDTRSKNQNLIKAKKRLSEKLDAIKKEDANKLKNEQRLDKIHNPTRVRTYNFIRNEAIDEATGRTVPLKKLLNGDLDLLR